MVSFNVNPSRSISNHSVLSAGVVDRASGNSANVICAVINAAKRCSRPANTRDRTSARVARAIPFPAGAGSKAMHKGSAHPEGRGNLFGVTARIAGPRDRFRKSIEYGAIATSMRTQEYHGRRTMYKSKTL
jgi:hypothetical protein